MIDRAMLLLYCGLVMLAAAEAQRITLHDLEAQFNSFYSVANSTMLRYWTLKVNTEVFGTNFITFFASDIDRYIIMCMQSKHIVHSDSEFD